MCLRKPIVGNWLVRPWIGWLEVWLFEQWHDEHWLENFWAQWLLTASDWIAPSKMEQPNRQQVFSWGVGSVSATQLLSGSWQIAEVTSSTVTLWKQENEKTVGAAEKVGGGPPAVAAWTASTLSVKNLWNWSTVMASLAGTRPRPNSNVDRNVRRSTFTFMWTFRVFAYFLLRHSWNEVGYIFH